MKFHPIKNTFDLNYNIEAISARKGLFLVITAKDYLMFDLATKSTIKRGSKNKEKSQI